MAISRALGGKGEVSSAKGADVGTLDGTSIASFYASVVGISDPVALPKEGGENIGRPDAVRNESGGSTFKGQLSEQQTKLEKVRGPQGKHLGRVESHSQASTSGRAAAFSLEDRDDTSDVHPTDYVAERRGAGFAGGPGQRVKQGTRNGALDNRDLSRGGSAPELAAFGDRPAKSGGLKLDERGLGNKLGTREKDSLYRIKIPEGNIGYKMLKKAGWNENKGLGASEQGPLEPVKTQVKGDKRGIGSQKQVRIPPGVANNKKRKDAPVVGNNGGKRQLTRAESKLKAETEKRKEDAIAKYIYRAFAPENV